KLGRFLQRDPIGTWGDKNSRGNTYAYAGIDPINARDPFGREADDDNATLTNNPWERDPTRELRWVPNIFSWRFVGQRTATASIRRTNECCELVIRIKGSGFWSWQEMALEPIRRIHPELVLINERIEAVG